MAFTFFFRDSETLELAIDEALPRLRGRAFIHVWDAGCAHGPETYTLAILLRERMSDYVFRNVQIHATDIDSSFAAQVTSGVFRDEEIKRVPADIVAKYFRPASRPGFVEIVPELRAKITFSHRDLLSLEPVREGLSLIVCKNVLLHFDEAQRTNVLRMFHRALQPGGSLVTERTQKLPEAIATCFRQVAPYDQVFHKLDGVVAEPRTKNEVSHPYPERPAGIHSRRPLPPCEKSHCG
jgi:chemotaxis protein methyltransferase CheR